MSTTEEKELEKLKQHFLFDTFHEDIRRKIIDDMAKYGNKGADTIEQRIFDPSIGNSNLVNYGLNTIKQIRESL